MTLMKNILTEQLEQFNLIELDCLNIDFKEETIRIGGTRPENRDSRIELVFEDVQAFFYNDITRAPAIVETLGGEGKCQQLRTIAYHNEGFGEFAVVGEADMDPEDLTDVVSVPNFNLDFGSSSLFIEAGGITINDRRFSLTRSS